MNASIDRDTQEPGTITWLLLIHQIPPKPDYLRVKVRRRLQRVGAVPLKNSVYLLPKRDDTAEDFHWLLHEIAADGGEVTLCEATFIAGVRDADLTALFRSDRDALYADIEQAARDLGGRSGNEPDQELATREAAIVRLKKRLADVAAVDFFGAPGRMAAERAIAAAEAASPSSESVGARAAGGNAMRERTWVTRTGVFVDRIASAWLIRRFIDPDARFKFVPPKGYKPAPDELRFDMYQAEYTHEGDRCTFETLLAKFGLDDPALAEIGEIVHDIDCKDEKFGRSESAGVAGILNGIAMTTVSDEARIERGTAIFDGLYAQLGRGAG